MLISSGKSLWGSVALLATALIWGLSFAAQRYGAGLLDAISLNVLRFVIGSATLFPIVLVSDGLRKRRGKRPLPFERGHLFGGVLCGLILFAATVVQQLGIESTSAGKAGFITALYIVFVPVLGLLARRKTPVAGRFAIVVALAGFWLLSVVDDARVTTGDMLVLLCAVCFSFQIIFIDIYAKGCDTVKFTFVQFMTATVAGLPVMAINGFPAAANVSACLVPLLYMGVLSSGAAYTLQVAGQQRVEPSVATLIMSLESIFALLGGIIILNESFTTRELGGCLLVFIGVFLAQFKIPRAFLSARELAPPLRSRSASRKYDGAFDNL